MTNKPSERQARSASTAIMLISISWTGGAIDAIAYGGLGHVFAANMTGHTVLLALSISGAEGLSMLRSIVAIFSFLAGVAVGSLLAAKSSHSDGKIRGLIRAVAVEAAILIAFTAVWFFIANRTQAETLVLIVAAAMAMGIQSAAVRNLDLPGVTTTYITGMYTQFISDLLTQFFGLGKRANNAQALDAKPQRRKSALPLQAGVLITYFMGAIVAGWTLVGIPSLAPLVGLAGLVGVALTVNSISLPENA
jgi:uncharacterized membrane protein YoaK (UPF0700 family)